MFSFLSRVHIESIPGCGIRERVWLSHFNASQLTTRNTWHSWSNGTHVTPSWNLYRHTRVIPAPGERPPSSPAKRLCSGTENTVIIIGSWIKQLKLVQLLFNCTLWTDISSTRHSSTDSSREWPEFSILMRWEWIDFTSSSSSPGTSGKPWKQG